MSPKDDGWTLLDEVEAELQAADERLSRRDRRTEAVMIIVDNALQASASARARPIRVGMVGAGFMGQGLTNQITNSVPGMRMAAIYNRTPERAERRLPLLRARGRRPRRHPGRLRRRRPRRAPASSPTTRSCICRSDRDRRHHRRHRLGRVRRPRDPRGVQARQARRDDERRGRRHDRPDPADVRPTEHGVTLSACDGDEPGLQMNLVPLGRRASA